MRLNVVFRSLSEVNESVKILFNMKTKKKLKIGKKKPDMEDNKANYECIVRENENFEQYYKHQKICPEEEWDEFMNCLRTQLPSSFRITHSKSEAKAMLTLIKGQYFKDVLNVKKEEGQDSIKLVALPWYPENLAWQIQLTRNDIRRSEAFFRLHNFLISETDSGSISRQEVVSMIPPIALDVQPHHKVLDMCAAPGSKTAQLIEYLHKNDRIPEGFIIANDKCNSRCYMLVHQAKRLNSPNIIVTNHDASAMPNFLVKNEVGGEEILKFDRVLCDVPCTGDGTLRKNPAIWPKWSISRGNNLNGMQFRIAKRGCEMLKVNGRLVYSTCSLNPVENEAVIMRLLTEAQGALKLVDLTPLLPGLKYQKGLTSWVLASKDMNVYKSYEEVPEKLQSMLKQDMFPPSEEVALAHNLHRCIRILPHHQDTGGFFIAAIEKLDKLPWETAKLKHQVEAKPENLEPQKKKKKFLGFREDPFVFFSDEEPVWLKMRKFYELSEDLPGNCFLTRCKLGKNKKIYLTSPQVRDIIINNADRIKIINSGVKVFVRDSKDSLHGFRLAQDGLPSIYPYIGPKLKVKVTKQDLLVMLGDPNDPKTFQIAMLDPATQEKVKEIGRGSCVLVYDEEPVTETSLHLELVGWVGAVTVRAYISNFETVHYLRLLGGDTSRFDVNKFQKPKVERNEQEKLDVDEPSMETTS